MSKKGTTKTTTSVDPYAVVEIDPSSPGTIVRVELVLESVLNLFIAYPAISRPHSTPQELYLPEPAGASTPSVETVMLVYWYGISMLALTVPMLLAIPNRLGAVESRRLVYILLAAVEAMWVPTVMFMARSDERIDAEKVIAQQAVPMALFLVFRLWVLFVKPHWLGRYRLRNGSHSKSGKPSTLSLERLQQDLATCAKLQRTPQDPSGHRDRNARYIDGHPPTLIKNATVWTGEPVPGTSAADARAGKGYGWVQADVLLSHGLIKTVGASIRADALADDVVVYEAGGRQLTAGIVDMHSHAGVDELPELRGWDDTNELSADITPFVRSLDGLDPLDPQIQVIKSGGVTTSLVLPGSGNNIGGEAFVVKHAVGRPDGRLEVSAEDMLADPGRSWRYIKMACGENAKRVYGKTGEHGPTSRLGESWEFRHAFEQASRLVKQQDDWCAAAAAGGVEAMDAYLPQDLRWETLGAVLRGQVHVNTHCYTVPDLEAFIDHTNEFQFPIRAFHHAHETYIVPELLKRAWGGRAPAAALFAENMLYKAEAYRGSEQAGKILYENGITPVYVSDNPVLNAQHVVFEAAKAFRYGLPYHAALAGVTTAPAELLGLGERIGKVKAGFDADVVVWDSDPLSVGATPVQVWIDGTAQYEDPYLLNKSRSDPIDSSKPLTRSTEDLDVTEDENVVFTGVRRSLLPGFEQAVEGAGESTNVVITNGKVACVGACDAELQAAAAKKVRTVKLQNGYLSPSFTILGSVLGLSEISAEADTVDGRHGNDVFSRAVDGLVLDNKQLAAAYRHGVTRAISAPVFSGGGARGVSAGFLTSASHPLQEGAVWSDEVSVHYTLTTAAKQGNTPSISSAIGALRSSLLNAAEFNETTAASKYSEQAYLSRVVAGELPLVITVDSADTIASILRVKAEVEEAVNADIRLAIVGGAESHLVAKELAAAGVGVVLAPLLQYAQSWDQRRSLTGAPLTNGTTINALLDAGVTTAIGITESWQARVLALSAATAYANAEGRLGESDALSLISTNVYKLLGLKNADDFVVFEGSPLEIQSRVVAVGSGRGFVSVYN
ncbi:putative amidohydrolase family protein [Neofusicoccum parvum UCRNP2]|uniref:Putative amidohydrolase family protein n=1 Tax=Botryosphaeria parva (strain UCR-NP2) TaxID=1287680 RepID=R1GLA6_BOTPV|nr:putative amidohydrolase family protein [Neofusicoccum parvum UCRNP2]